MEMLVRAQIGCSIIVLPKHSPQELDCWQSVRGLSLITSARDLLAPAVQLTIWR